jgi:hypothetical protein
MTTVTANCFNKGVVDCADPFSILLFSLLALGRIEGATAEEIQTQFAITCPNTEYTLEEVQAIITAALKQGLISPAVSGTTYSINAAMLRANYSANKPYYCVGLFYKC